MAVGTPEGERRAGPGQVIFVPWDAPFNWRNAGPGPLRYFAMYRTAGFEEFFADAAAAWMRPEGCPPNPLS